MDDEYDEATPPEGEDPICDGCGVRTDVVWEVDPYAWEIDEELWWGWWCPRCYQDRADDI